MKKEGKKDRKCGKIRKDCGKNETRDAAKRKPLVEIREMMLYYRNSGLLEETTHHNTIVVRNRTLNFSY